MRALAREHAKRCAIPYNRSVAHLVRCLRRPLLLGLALGALGLLGRVQPARAQVEAEFKDEFDSAASAPAKATPAPAKAAPAPTTAPVAQPAPAPSPSQALVVDAEKPSAKAEAADEAEAAPESREAQLSRVQNTWLGPSGGLHVVDAGSGAPGTLRLQLGVDFFSSHNFLLPQDSNSYSGGTFSLSWTLNDYLELFASVANHANFNDKEQPRLLQVLGDTSLGLKGFDAVLPWLTLGGDFRFVVLNTVGDIGPVLDALSFGLRGNATADLRQLHDPVPLIGRLSLDYFFDNSASLIADVESQRYAALGPDRRPRAEEDRNLIRRVERFALGINRADAFTFALGVEAPLRAATDFFIHPLLEWTLSIPVNRQGYSCLLVPTNGRRGSDDGCLKIVGLAAMPSTLTFGARVFPPVRGLSFALALDLGLSGTSRFVRELAPNKPYDVLIALGYAIDPRERPEKVREVEVVRELPKPPPPKPRVEGLAVDAGTGGPVAGATIRYPGLELTAQQADAQGRFVSYELEPGEARFELSHPDYELRVCSLQLPKPEPAASAPPARTAPATPAAAPPAASAQPASGQPVRANPASRVAAPPMVPLRCELTAKPRAGSVRGTVLSETGQPIAGAHVDLIGPSSQSLETDGQGQFVVVSLAIGSYGARAEANGYLIRLVSFEVAPGATATPEIALVQKPKQAQVELTKQEVRIHKQIFFNTNSAQISDKSHGLLSEIADVLLRNPQVKSVEIQGHTDSTGAPEANQQLSQQRADAVREWLIGAGVDAGRLSAKGYGDTRPLVPNLTERHRAANRRVQFIIKAQD
jgi:outer membrane protein OmpA-like peptidoglycan-associated protein